ncbi:MAG: 4Fe-4S dicluster domain-containing protein [Armatimonadetes bacterium]|nr:4Fe-4S dicluster domain-containing protein [Armatimonadota bacterium]
MSVKEKEKGPRWGMVADVDRCTGCKACVLACRSENNVPVVGEQEVNRGRILDWIHVDRFWKGEYPDVTAEFIPMLCQHCEKAPCESVCPVYASHHSHDGLNAQIYNRCVGTRFCANNCPYHVRVFNFFSPRWPQPLEQQLNPDVTARDTGVMEKCTFCVQRIRRAELDARLRGKPLRDGELRPACVQSCPTSALVFGDFHDPHSAVSKTARSPRAVRVLEDLGTEPRIVYLKADRRKEII